MATGERRVAGRAVEEARPASRTRGWMRDRLTPPRQMPAATPWPRRRAEPVGPRAPEPEARGTRAVQEVGQPGRPAEVLAVGVPETRVVAGPRAERQRLAGRLERAAPLVVGRRAVVVRAVAVRAVAVRAAAVRVERAPARPRLNPVNWRSSSC